MPWRDMVSTRETGSNGETLSPKKVGQLTLMAAFTLLVLVVVAVLGQVPLGSPSGTSILRLALRTVQNRVEVCRDRSAAELESLPVHMRQPRVCDMHSPTFRLSVSVDGKAIHGESVDPGGMRGDRPLIVDRQLSVEPGRVRLEVAFEPVVGAGLEPAVLAAFADLASYHLVETVTLEEDRITLVLLDDQTGRLQIYGQ